MGMAEDVAHIKWALSQVSNLHGVVETLNAVKDKLKYDIEPKLDKALEGKAAPDPAKPQLSPDDMLRKLRYCILYATSGRKIKAIKELRAVTNAGLKEAKDTVEWIAQRIADMAEEQNEKETF